MKIDKRAEIIQKWIDEYCRSAPFKLESLIIGISGGIDSSVVSTLCALTNRKTIVFLVVRAQSVLTTDESIPPEIPTTNAFGSGSILLQYTFIQSLIIFALFFNSMTITNLSFFFRIMT
jgi:NH3-dependent NAD+ synthetase